MRKLVLIAALAGCAGTTGVRGPGPPPCHQADSLESMEAGMPARVEHFDVPGASLCLVHVIQEHVPPQWTTPRPPSVEPGEVAERLDSVNRVQRDIYGILRVLSANGFSDVFAEGVTVEEPLLDRHSLELMYFQALVTLQANGCLTPEAIADVAPGRGVGTKKAERVRYLPGADLLLAIEGEIRLLPAERRDSLRAAQAALAAGDLAPPPGSPARRALFDDREDTILGVVAAHEGRTAVLVLGGAHDLTDNVRRWNRLHPERSISLMVVTPRSYRP